jgi:hypothetical protein
LVLVAGAGLSFNMNDSSGLHWLILCCQETTQADLGSLQEKGVLLVLYSMQSHCRVSEIDTTGKYNIV